MKIADRDVDVEKLLGGYRIEAGRGFRLGKHDPEDTAGLKLAKEVASHSNHTGMTHAQVHSHLRQTCGGPSVASATLEELQARIDRLDYESRPIPAPVQVRQLPVQRESEQLGLFG